MARTERTRLVFDEDRDRKVIDRDGRDDHGKFVSNFRPFERKSRRMQEKQEVLRLVARVA